VYQAIASGDAAKAKIEMFQLLAKSKENLEYALKNLAQQPD
jgi:DNA-binding FadR family transcriptional regulator